MKLNFTYSDELYHYGVKGMKWGVRRGGQSSGQPRHTGNGGRSGMSAERKAKIKKAAKITAGVVGAAALAYGAHKYKQKRDNKLLPDYTIYNKTNGIVSTAFKYGRRKDLPGRKPRKYIIFDGARQRASSARPFLLYSNKHSKKRRPKSVRYSKSALAGIRNGKKWLNGGFPLGLSSSDL